jgi:hypothetical protein
MTMRGIGRKGLAGVAVVTAVALGLGAACRAQVFRAPPVNTAGATATAPAVRLHPPAPTAPPAAPSGSFPNASNTGVPAGTALSAYTGPCTITVANTVIDAQTVTCGTLTITANTTITRSKVNGVVDNSSGATLNISDTEIDGGHDNQPALGFDHINASRLNVHGARQSSTCSDYCVIQDSWFHGQYLQPGSNWHVNGWISNGGTNVTLRHNTLACEPGDNGVGGGCTGPAAAFGDFGPLANITFDRNLFVAGPGSYCLYAGYDPSKPYGSNSTNIVVTNNVFQRGANGKCAYYGAVAAFMPGSGNIFANNTWDDGTALNW